MECASSLVYSPDQVVNQNQYWNKVLFIYLDSYCVKCLWGLSRTPFRSCKTDNYWRTSEFDLHLSLSNWCSPLVLRSCTVVESLHSKGLLFCPYLGPKLWVRSDTLLSRLYFFSRSHAPLGSEHYCATIHFLFASVPPSFPRVWIGQLTSGFWIGGIAKAERIYA